ncbi:pimeloyl-ACP methyl ester carboxylesterase [Allocatelliglobosispora scoriae]|uniref:Pimeloyl-ACP methyl ester carboxylesterase n=1 Tax=Allocatelliglobosispora scoriae TaxID=643052 RepID=A0A841BKF6_9ACTN|nr:alpha/beta hydrolase [Allocatelliglobosispora scoriae]MBB5868125.1 pimeloyl-ACP methyl ester carboxylesterase [Allocatelliglobosispora scoriae]
MRARSLGLAASVLVVVAATACGQTLAPTASPSPSAAPAVAWQPCQATVPDQCKARFAQVECGALAVPLDYANPSGERIALGMVRVKAAGNRLGSLVFNFGGPGGTGVQTLLNRWLLGSVDTLQSRYDLVSFDPRGVGQSSPVACLDNAGDEAFLRLDHTPSTDAQIQAFAAGQRAYTKGCQTNSGKILPYVGTASAAKDLDVIRQAVGDDKLNFFGVSYGTWLGADYANQFPDRVGRMFLDSAVDPTLSQKDLDLEQAKAQDANLTALLADCAKQGGTCPLTAFGTTTDALRARIAQFSQQLDATPLVAGKRTLSQEMFLLGLGSAVGAASQRPQVTAALAAGMKGDATGLIAMADAATGRQADGTFENTDEANRAIRCADDTTHYSVDQVKGFVGEFTAAAPIFGAGQAWDGLRCLDWPYAGDNAAKDVSAPTSATTIVVAGSTGDPATPYAWSPALVKQLGNAQLITNDGPYHGAYLSGAECVQQKANAYLFDGTLPGNTTCP